MTVTAESEQEPSPMLAGKLDRSAAIVWLCGAIWFFTLSGVLGVESTSALGLRRNVLFHSDASLWLELLTRDSYEPQAPFRFFSHSFMYVLWRPIVRTLATVLNMVGVSDPAVATRAVVSFVAGGGLGAIAYVGGRFGVEKRVLYLLLTVGFLFTVNTVIALPEYFGLSAGILSITFAIWISATSFLRRGGVFLGGVVAAGTTITNGYLAVLLLISQATSWHWRRKVVTALSILLGAGGAILSLVKFDPSTHEYVHGILRRDALTNPGRTAAQFALSAVYPAVGPKPEVRAVDPVREPRLMVWYHPFGFSRYPWWQVPGVIAWLILLFAGGRRAFADPRTRIPAAVLVSWVVINATLHVFWRDDPFLYSPHWAWSLLALVVIGSRGMRYPFVAALVVPLVVAQAGALVMVINSVRHVLLSPIR